MLCLCRRKDSRISDALEKLGVEIETNNVALRAKMASDMFNTNGRIVVFEENNNMKEAPISKFPKDLFFVLRTTQLLRGLSNGMGIDDFNAADQWVPFARRALRDLRSVPDVVPV